MKSAFPTLLNLRYTLIPYLTLPYQPTATATATATATLCNINLRYRLQLHLRYVALTYVLATLKATATL